MIKNILYKDKIAIQNDASIPDENKVTDENMNEIKNVVNNNANELTTAKGIIEDLQEEQGTSNVDITSLKTRVSTLETDNTKNKSDINALNSDNKTNKSNIATMQEQISDIQQEQQTQNANIEKLKQEDIDIKEELEKTKKEFNDYAIHGQASGEVIHLTDSAKSSCEVDLKGNTKQETRISKNLFNIETATMYSGTKELTSDKTGFILRKGTNRVNNYALTKALQPGTYTIYFKFKIENSTFNEQNVGFIFKNISQDDVGGTVCATVNDTYALKVITNEEVHFLYCFINNGENADCVATITDFMILEGEHTNDESYERYGASPSLNYPSKIKTVGNNVNSLHMQEKSYTQLGVNVTQEESCLKLDGTTNASQNLLSGDYVDIGNFKKGKHIFKVHTSGSYKRYDKDDFAIYIREKNNTSKSYGVITGTNIEKDTNSFIFELTEDTDLVIQIWVNASGIIFSKFEMKLKIEKGEIATSYSPYNLGSVKVTSSNKNIFNNIWKLGAIDLNTGKDVESGSEISSEFIKIIPNEKFTASRVSTENAKLRFYDKNKNYLGSGSNQGISFGSKTEVTFYLDAEYVRFNIQSTNLNYELLLELGDTATQFIEHEENSVIVPIQKEMLEEDYIDKENKKEVHNWEKYEITGNENWRKHATTSNNAFYFEAKNIFTNAETPANNKEEATIINTHYKNYAVDTIAQNNIEGTGLAMNTAYYIGTGLDGISTLEEFKAKMQELYNAETPVTLYYKLKEPTKLDLTPEQIEASKKLDEMQTYKNITNITTDSIAILDIDYKKDLETLINQVSQAVVEGS